MMLYKGIDMSKKGNSDENPIGSIIALMGTTAPNGYLICNGQEYQISKYKELANFFQTSFGSKNYFGGDGETTFAVPDLRDKFLRGFHEDSSEQLSGEIGKLQEGTIIPRIISGSGNSNPNIAYYFEQGSNSNEVTNIDSKERMRAGLYFIEAQGLAVPVSDDDFKAYTTRPVNVAVLYCIKAIPSSVTVDNIYSTDEETCIGIWIDGKPLYRKVFELTTPGSPSTVTDEILYWDGDVETVSHIYGYLKTISGQFAPIPYYTTTDDRCYVAYNPASHTSKPCTFRCSVGYDNISRPLVVIIEYTKLTD